VQQDDLLHFFTQEQDVIDIIKPVFPIVVPYIAAGMVRSVMYGMAWAMQEFGYIAFFEVSHPHLILIILIILTSSSPHPHLILTNPHLILIILTQSSSSSPILTSSS
jgi:hypothetical protein